MVHHRKLLPTTTSSVDDMTEVKQNKESEGNELKPRRFLGLPRLQGKDRKRSYSGDSTSNKEEAIIAGGSSEDEDENDNDNENENENENEHEHEHENENENDNKNENDTTRHETKRNDDD